MIAFDAISKARWWFQIFFIFTTARGKLSNLTSIFFKWVVQPPTRKCVSYLDHRIHISSLWKNPRCLISAWAIWVVGNIGRHPNGTIVVHTMPLGLEVWLSWREVGWFFGVSWVYTPEVEHSPWKMVVGRRSFPIGKVTSTKTNISPIFLPFFGGHTFLVVFHNDKHPSCPTPPKKISTEGRACDPFDCNEDLKGWKTRTRGIFHRDQKSCLNGCFWVP